jgi:MFS family permease
MQVISYWLKARNVDDTAIGIAQSFYYFGLAVASCAVPWLTRRMSAQTCAGLGMIGAGVTLGLFPWAGEICGWCLLRFASGWAGAMSLVPLETVVSRDSLPERKTQNFACYAVSLTVGGALGMAVGAHLYVPGDALAFYVGAGAALAGGVGLLSLFHHSPSSASPTIPASLDLARNFLSYGAAWSLGFLEGGMLVFLPLFLVGRGFSEENAGMLMGVTTLGVIFFQIPVSWLADRLGKTPMLLSCYAAVAIGLLAIPWLSHGVALAAGLFCFGACSGAMYPLGLALLSDRVPPGNLARAYAWYLAIECVGSQAGAALMGKARDIWSETAMFHVGLVTVASVFALWLGVRFTSSMWPGKQNLPIQDQRRAA